MRRLLVFGWVFLSGTAAMAQPPVKVASIEGVTEYRLANGARVLLFPEASRPTVTVNLTVLVGSRHEGYGESGMAHLLEHMVFKGTPYHPLVPKALRDHGASFNGTTNNDRTNYFETMPATDENLEFGIALESDRLVNSFVKGEDLKSEMTVVRNEFERGENSPSFDPQSADLRPRPTNGTTTASRRSAAVPTSSACPSTISRPFTRNIISRITSCWSLPASSRRRRPSPWCKNISARSPRPTRKLDPTYTEEPAQDGERTVTLRRVGAVGSVGVAYHVPGGLARRLGAAEPAGRHHLAGAQRPALQGLGRIKAGHQRVRPRGRRARSRPLFRVRRPASRRALDPVREALVKTLESLGDVPFTEDEVNKAKVRSKRNAEMLQSNSQAMVPGAELGIEPRRLAAAVHPARSRRRRDRVRRQPRGERPISRSPTARSASTSLPRNRRDWRCPPPPPSTWS